MSKRTEETVSPKINLADCCVPLPRHPAENGTCTQQAKKHTPSAYSEKLKNPRWQKKRLEIFERDGWKCRACQDEKSTLHVHHLPPCDSWGFDNGVIEIRITRVKADAGDKE